MFLFLVLNFHFFIHSFISLLFLPLLINITQKNITKITTEIVPENLCT